MLKNEVFGLFYLGLFLLPVAFVALNQGKSRILRNLLVIAIALLLLTMFFKVTEPYWSPEAAHPHAKS